jgi:hypothetical protein
LKPFERAPLIAAVLCVTGCPTPTQYGGPIPVDTSGFEARARILSAAGLSARIEISTEDAGTYGAPK